MPCRLVLRYSARGELAPISRRIRGYPRAYQHGQARVGNLLFYKAGPSNFRVHPVVKHMSVRLAHNRAAHRLKGMNQIPWTKLVLPNPLGCHKVQDRSSAAARGPGEGLLERRAGQRRRCAHELGVLSLSPKMR